MLFGMGWDAGKLALLIFMIIDFIVHPQLAEGMLI